MNVHILHSAKYAALRHGERYEISDMLCSSNAAKAVQTIISLAIIAFHSNLLEVVSSCRESKPFVHVPICLIDLRHFDISELWCQSSSCAIYLACE